MANTTYKNVLSIEQAGNGKYLVTIKRWSTILTCITANEKAVSEFNLKGKKWKSAGIRLYDECVIHNEDLL